MSPSSVIRTESMVFKKGAWAVFGLLALVLLVLWLILFRSGDVRQKTEASILKVALQSSGRTLDPHRAVDAASIRMTENMYSGLLRYASEYGEWEYDLAKSHQRSKNGLTYTFELRRGILFHNSGNEMTAEDVRYSIERIIDKQIRAEHFALLDRVEVVSRYRVAFHLKQPMASFLSVLSYPMNVIVERPDDGKDLSEGEFSQRSFGTGPFQFESWQKGRRLILKRSSKYYEEELPYLDELHYRPISDETARTIALRNREVDLVLSVPHRDVETLKEASHVRVFSEAGTFWEYIGLNTKTEPFDDIRVRQAVAWAVDRKEINDIVKLGQSRPLQGGILPPEHWAYADFEQYPQPDLARAKELLAEAEVELPLQMELLVGSAFEYQVDAAQVVKQQLQDIGIEVEIRAQESSIFFDALGHGEFEMTVVGWLGFVDPDEWLYNIFHSKGKWNQQSYQNKEVDELLEAGRRELRRSKRKEIYRKIQMILAREAPMVFLYINPQISAALNSVENFRVHPTETAISLRSVKVNRGDE